MTCSGWRLRFSGLSTAISASNLKWHNDINTYYAHQENIGAANGIAPLDENTKLPAGNLLFGNEAGTVFEGSAGKELEDSVNVHKADNSRRCV